jgi:hypothetical protein
VKIPISREGDKFIFGGAGYSYGINVETPAFSCSSRLHF